ncbi:MAG TPA: AAA family ATPase [Rhizomicrobium sp.]|nr:AAA family ATPase [Rhizomicrobium sp.]
MLTKSDADCAHGNTLTGREATARFVELLTGLQNATMRWHVSKGTNLEEFFYRVEGTHDALSRRLQKDQRADRNIGMWIGGHQERGQWQSLGAVYIEFGEEYSDGYIDFHLHPDFIVTAGKASWTAYWLTTSTDRSELRKLRHALAQHYEQETTRMYYARPVPGFDWHTEGDPAEVKLIDFTGKLLGDYSHWEGLHTLEDLSEGLAENSGLKFRADDPGYSSDRNYDPLADDASAASSESYFPCYLDGEQRSAPATNDLITNFLPDDSLYMLYGATGSLKTFVMLDVAYTAASGTQLWPNSGGPNFSASDRLKVVFIAGEGQSDFGRRVEAWKRHHGIVQRLDVLIVPVMPRFDSQTQLKDLVKTVSNKLGYADILIVDTLMEASAGFNISDPSNARDFIMACKYLRRHLLCSICLIHHTGKDHKGHLGAEHLKAAVDIVDKVEMKSASGTSKTIRIAQEKNRDRGKRGDIVLEAIEVEAGRGESGDPVTSLVLKRTAGQDATSPSPKEDLQRVALRVLEERSGTGPLSIQELVAGMLDQLPAANLTDDARQREVDRLRKVVSALAKGALKAHAKRGPGSTAPWLFELSKTPATIAAE